MLVKRSNSLSRLALGVLGSLGGSVISAGLLAALPVQPVHAQSIAACAATKVIASSMGLFAMV